MAASVASSWGPGLVVGVRRPVRFAGRARAIRGLIGEAELASLRGPSADFAPVVVRVPRSAPPLRRRFELDAPEVAEPVPVPVSRRARRIEHPAPGQVRVRRRARSRRARPVPGRVPVVPGRLRLTRRGRVLALVLIAVAVYAAFGLGRASAGGTPPGAHASTVVVQQGDSLWSIALRAYPNSDPRDAVDRLKAVNHLGSSDLAVGQRLQLP